MGLKEIIQEDRTVWKRIIEKSISEEPIEKYLFNEVYGDALKKTGILTGKTPWYAKLPLLKRINGYDKSLEKLEEAATLAIEQRNRIEGVLGALYTTRDKKMEFRENAIQKTALLKDRLEEVKGTTQPSTSEEDTTLILKKTDEMRVEDAITKQIMTAKAVGDSITLIDSIIVIYRDLLLEFNKRAELGTALFKMHGGMLKW